METTPREQILKKVRQAVMEKTKNPYPSIDLETSVFKNTGEDPVIDFASEFTKAGGQFFYCSNKFDFVNLLLQLSEDKMWDKFFCKEASLLKMLEDTNFKFIQIAEEISHTDAIITQCEGVLYRSGSLLVSNLNQPRKAIVNSNIHIIVAFTSQLQKDLKDCFSVLKSKNQQKLPKWISFITGPSKSNEIENIVVNGILGSREVLCFLIEDRKAYYLAKLFEE